MNEDIFYNNKKMEMLFIAQMISMFSGYSLKEISNMEKEQVDSYIETLKRSINFAKN